MLTVLEVDRRNRKDGRRFSLKKGEGCAEKIYTQDEAQRPEAQEEKGKKEITREVHA